MTEKEILKQLAHPSGETKKNVLRYINKHLKKENLSISIKQAIADLQVQVNLENKNGQEKDLSQAAWAESWATLIFSQPDPIFVKPFQTLLSQGSYFQKLEALFLVRRWIQKGLCSFVELRPFLAQHVDGSDHPWLSFVAMLQMTRFTQETSWWNKMAQLIVLVDQKQEGPRLGIRPQVQEILEEMEKTKLNKELHKTGNLPL